MALLDAYPQFSPRARPLAALLCILTLQLRPRALALAAELTMLNTAEARMPMFGSRATADEPMAKIGNELLDRVVKAAPSYTAGSARLDQTTLQKVGHTAIRYSSRLPLTTPTDVISHASLPAAFRSPRLAGVQHARSEHRERRRFIPLPAIRALPISSMKAQDPEQKQLRSLLMLSVFGAIGAFSNLLPVYLTSIMQKSEVGALLCLQQFLGVAINPVVAGLTDIYRTHRLVIVSSAFGQAFLQLCLILPGLGSFGIAAALLAQSLFQAQIPNIMDASTIAAVGARYGNIRLWGSLGFGASALLAGGLASFTGDPKAAFGLSSALYLLSVPALSSLNVTNLWGDGKRERPTTLAFIKKILSVRTALFYIVTFCSGVSYGIIINWLNVHLQEQGASAMLMGCGRLITCLVEVPFFQLANVFLQRLGVAGCLAFAQAAYVCRFVWYANLASFVDLVSSWFGVSRNIALWGFLPSELLHGITFAVLQNAVVQFASKVAPEGMQTTSQSVAATMHYTLGLGVGASVGGLLLDRVGGSSTFQASALFSAANFGLCMVGLVAYGKQWDHGHRLNATSESVTDLRIAESEQDCGNGTVTDE